MSHAAAGVLSYAGDFRAAATQASTPATRGKSRCLRIEEPDPVAGGIRRDIVLAGIAGLGGEVVGVAIGLAGIGLLDVALVLAGLGVFVSGVSLAIAEAVRRPRRLRRLLARRGCKAPSSARCVAVENARTFSSLKSVPDDVAMLWTDPPAGLLVMEGLTHRYVIARDDVTRVTVRRAPTMCCTSIGYRIIDVELELVISENVIHPVEVIKQTIGLRPRLYPVITAAIGAPNAGRVAVPSRSA